jgi:hypothetical protein
MLDFTLGRLQQMRNDEVPFEVVVSDNCSRDETPQIVEKHREQLPRLRYCRHRKEVLPFVGILNAIRNATGKYAIFLADDDSLIPDVLFRYVQQMENDPGLTAIYSDLIAYDDEQEKEIHRYFYLKQPAQFGPNDPIGLINYVVTNLIYPEIGVYRREPFLRCDAIIKRGFLPYHMWMYRLSRLGRIAFEPEPFYREHRVVKKHLRREGTTNMDFRLQYIGDEFRNVLETMVLWAFQDAGMPQVPEPQALVVRRMIERFLHMRLGLEIQRAASEKNWIQAVELRRRFTLWNGPGSLDEQRRDTEQLAIPAAFQAIREAYENLSDVSGLLFVDFQGTTVSSFFRTHYPEIPLLDPTSPNLGTPLVIYKQDRGTADEAFGAPAGYRLYLDRLLETYRVAAIHIDVSQL